MIKRIQVLRGRGQESCFLWGPRQTGKSTLLKQLFPAATRYDLLLSDEYRRLSARPATFREEVLAADNQKTPIIVDEVQKIPALLDEIQWLMSNHNSKFILCGSSARKLKRGAGNLLGGRALRYELFPLVWKEIHNFDLARALNHGLLPKHYLSDNPSGLLKAYVGDYLKEEIAAEALSRNVPLFHRFLEAAAFSNGEIVNYVNIAQDCGVSSPTVKNYFQILEDTMIGTTVPSFQKRPKRRIILAPKFYFFDIGITNMLLKRSDVVKGSEVFGRAFEHFIFQEIRAHSHYSQIEYPVSYWRTASQLEIDFILGDHEVALEIKGSDHVSPHHMRGLRAFMEEYKVKHSIVVSCDPKPRLADGISILPWQIFLEKLWDGKLIS